MLNIGILQRAPHSHPVQQVFSCRQVRLERRFVTDVSKITVICPNIAADIDPTPGDGSLLRIHDSTEGPQKAGLSGAIPTGNLEAFAGIHREPDTLEDMAIAPPQVQILGLQ